MAVHACSRSSSTSSVLVLLSEELFSVLSDAEILDSKTD